ncbi:MAG: hypothetical protein WC440_03720 [Candidatus Omnitrophota bacterium]|jgi:hypothetical protein
MRGKRRWFLLFTLYFLLFTLCGCEAFVRKFTRKSKKDKGPVEMVLEPEEWKGPKMTKEERYRQYFVFWQSWQDELINALTQNAPQKKKLDCVQQAFKNLVGMRSLLNESKQKQLDVYLKLTAELRDDIKSDIYGTANNFYRQNSEKLKMNISRYFTYSDVRNDII